MYEQSEITPYVALVSASARRHAEVVRCLFVLDRRLGHILGIGQEVMMAQFRLAWWRDALTGDAPTGEPLADGLLALDADRTLRPSLLAMVDGWEEWIARRDAPAEIDLDAYAAQRGQGLFAALARAMGHVPDDATGRAGRLWSLWDMAAWSGDECLISRAVSHAQALAEEPVTDVRWPGPLRLMSIPAQADIRRGCGAPKSMTPGLYLRLLRAQIFGR